MLVSHPVIVVGLPAYNEAIHLQQTLDALRRQTFSHFAVLIADNASTDATGVIGRQAARDDPRFIYHRHQTNIGSAANFNFISECSDSPYLLWLGAHDLLAANALEHHVRTLESRPEVSISTSAHEWIDVNDRPLWRISDGALDGGEADDPHRYLRSIGQNRNNIAANSAIRRSMLGDARFSSVVGTDRILASRLAFRGPYATTSETLYFRRSFEKEDRMSYMERLTGRSGSVLDWMEFARAYDADFASLLNARPDAARLRRRLQLLLRYHLPVGLGSPLTTTLWTIRRARKWSRRILTWRILNLARGDRSGISTP